jgi:hypothetical protein
MQDTDPYQINTGSETLVGGHTLPLHRHCPRIPAGCPAWESRPAGPVRRPPPPVPARPTGRSRPERPGQPGWPAHPLLACRRHGARRRWEPALVCTLKKHASIRTYHLKNTLTVLLKQCCGLRFTESGFLLKKRICIGTRSEDWNHYRSLLIVKEERKER